MYIFHNKKKIPLQPSAKYIMSLISAVSRQASLWVPWWLQNQGSKVNVWWELMNKPSEFYRDTYSDRSGSSSPDSEITELKFPSINHD